MGHQWRPLNKGREEIRLLDLNAGAEGFPLSGKLRHAFLSERARPSYETISYAWGDPALVEEIVVDARCIAIPASAAAALRCMRLPQCDRTLWIDCICIDQDNDDEKSHQVSLMAKVFASSIETLAFLGTDNDNTAALAFKSFSSLSDLLKESNGNTLSMMPDHDIQIPQQARDALHWTAMHGILPRPYFE
jgi:hypothetical protein